MVDKRAASLAAVAPARLVFTGTGWFVCVVARDLASARNGPAIVHAGARGTGGVNDHATDADDASGYMVTWAV